MKMEFICLLGIVAGFPAIATSAAPAAIVADFSGGGTPAGWTVGNGEYRSPEYAAAVDRIELRYAGPAADGAAAVYASSAQGESQVATFTLASSSAAFDFPETTDFRSFRVTAANGLALSSFAAYVSSSTLDAPAGVAISNNTTGTSFDACWDPVAGASGYRVYVWTNAVAGASAGVTAWLETMPGATNAASSTKLTDAKFNDCFENSGWTRSDKAGYPTGEDGTIRIGTSDANGWLQTPSVAAAADGMAVRFYAKANAANTKSMDVAVERVSGGTAHFAGAATITTEMQEFVVELPGWESGDAVRFNSLTNGDRRTVIGSVAVVSGYSTGAEAPSYIVDGQDVGSATAHAFAGLPSVPVFFAVEAYGKRGVTSPRTEPVAVDLSNPDKVAVLNACPISSLAGGVYAQDFDSLAEATATTGAKEWLNGTTLPCWQAYRGAAAVTAFNYNAGAVTIGGLYALSPDRGDDERALGAYSSQSDEFSFGIAFTNDMDAAVTLSSVAYSAQQWGFKNTASQTLSVAAQVADGLDWISAYDGGWTELGSTESSVYGKDDAHDTPVSAAVSFGPDNGISVAPGKVLMLKWTVHSLKTGTPGMLAIDDVSVTFAPAPGFAIRIADGAGHRR